MTDHEISVLKAQIMQENKKDGFGSSTYLLYLYLGVGVLVGGFLMAMVQRL